MLKNIINTSAGVRELETPKYKCEALIIEGLEAWSPSGVQGQSLWSGDRSGRQSPP